MLSVGLSDFPHPSGRFGLIFRLRRRLLTYRNDQLFRFFFSFRLCLCLGFRFLFCLGLYVR